MAETILLVDDDPDYRAATRTILETADYEVEEAANADEAKEALESGTPDLILLDVYMPGENGFDLSDELAEREELEGVPVILVSVLAEHAGEVMYAFEQGKGCRVADVLPKDDVSERLMDVVSTELESE